MADMSGLQDIAVKVIGPGGLSGNAEALLHEIATLLAALVTEGRSSSIDLQGLPLTPADREYLRERLGAGEVRALVDALGPSEVRETAYRGVWWVTHRNAADELCAELIEVTPVPQILLADRQEIVDALERLRLCLCDGAARGP
jgi:hydrogenase-1 operon protein HyaF